MLFAVALAFVGIGVLIFYLHHIGTAIQASHIIAAVAADTIAAVDRLFPEKPVPVDEADAAATFPPQPSGRVVAARRTGYIQRVSIDALSEVARAQQTIVRMEHGVGAFVIEGMPLASLLGGDPHDRIDPDVVRRVNAAYTIDRQRTGDEDATFGIRQLVDVALKGLSPGINDVTTAVMCVDYLTTVLVRLAGRELASPVRTDAGEVRVISRYPSYADLVAATFDEIRQNAGGNVTMLRRLLEALATLGDVTTSPVRRRVLRWHADAVAEVISRTVDSPHDRDALERQAKRVSASLTHLPTA